MLRIFKIVFAILFILVLVFVVRYFDILKDVLVLNMRPEPQCQNQNKTVLASTVHLKDLGNGTIADSKTGLVWKKCSEGQTWHQESNTCLEVPLELRWREALRHAQGHAQNGNTHILTDRSSANDWRMPNTKELSSITEAQCWNPAINAAVFPNTPAKRYWSSTPFRQGTKPSSNRAFKRSGQDSDNRNQKLTNAWYTGFDSGLSDIAPINSKFVVRLVRGPLAEPPVVE